MAEIASRPLVTRYSHWEICVNSTILSIDESIYAEVYDNWQITWMEESRTSPAKTDAVFPTFNPASNPA